MIKVIKFKKNKYPKFQTEGNAAQFIMPFAKHICNGYGYDIGCGKKEWAFPGSVPIDIIFKDEFDAYNLPKKKADYIFSSHCLEHLEDWVLALDLWIKKLKNGGNLFLYLPDYTQEYWRPWNNRKHKHVLSPKIISDFLEDRKMDNIFTSGVDLNNSFIAIANKRT